MSLFGVSEPVLTGVPTGVLAGEPAGDSRILRISLMLRLIALEDVFCDPGEKSATAAMLHPVIVIIERVRIMSMGNGCTK